MARMKNKFDSAGQRGRKKVVVKNLKKKTIYSPPSDHYLPVLELNSDFIKNGIDECIEEKLAIDHLNIFLEKIRGSLKWNFEIERYVAIFLYMVLKITGLSRSEICRTLNLLGTLSDRTAHDYVIRIINGEDNVAFENERGFYKRHTIYDEYPELEQ